MCSLLFFLLPAEADGGRNCGPRLGDEKYFMVSQSTPILLVANEVVPSFLVVPISAVPIGVVSTDITRHMKYSDERS